jgi:hypothetical protein
LLHFSAVVLCVIVGVASRRDVSDYNFIGVGVAIRIGIEFLAISIAIPFLMNRRAGQALLTKLRF